MQENPAVAQAFGVWQEAEQVGAVARGEAGGGGHDFKPSGLE